MGVTQKPMDGQSLLPSLAACDAAKPRTQYFEIGGKVGLYDNGWFLSGDDGRTSWQDIPAGVAKPPITWSLYNLDKDFSQSTDLAAREPARLAQMQELWRQEATRNNVFPLEHRFPAGGSAQRSHRGSGRKHFDFWGKNTSVPGTAEPMLIGRSYTLDADLVLDKPEASGAIVAMGSHFGGWSLYLDKGRPAFTFARSTDPQETQHVTAAKALPAGASRLRMRFAVPRPGGPAEVTLSSGGEELAQVSLPTSIAMPAGGGETLDIGRDLGVTVTEYATPNGAIEGDVPHVSVTFD